MIHKKLFLFILPLVAFVWIISYKDYTKKTGDVNPLGISNTSNRPTHPLVFFDENNFFAGLQKSNKEKEFFTYQISGGIIPHHLFPSFMIADFFDLLSKQKPKTIILIGPNHFERGSYKVLSSMYGWETPFGIVEPNEQIIQELEKSGLIKIDEINLPKEHSVAGIMPFIKYYIPDAKVVPLILSWFMTKEDLKLLSSGLMNHISKDTVIIAAVDFSHYLINKQAQEKDMLTLELISSFNYEKILSLNNNFLDSPPSIVAFLMTIESLGSTKMEVLHHTNSGEMQKDDSIETTSYFSIVYH